MSSLTYQIVSREPAVVAFQGAVDTTFISSVPGLITELQAMNPAEVLFDCGGITHVNSIGVVQWMTFLERLPERTTYKFAHCTTSFVGYAMLVHGFVGDGKIVSLNVLYACGNCGMSMFRVFDLATHAFEDEDFSRNCSRCAHVLVCPVDLDDLLDGLPT